MTRAALATTDSERWPAQGEWTYEDYVRLPDDGWRYEIIEGVLHVSPAPSYRHQSIVGNLLFLFRLFLRDHPVARAVPAPVDVVLPGIASPVQPDLVVVVVERLDSIVDDRPGQYLVKWRRFRRKRSRNGNSPPIFPGPERVLLSFRPPRHREVDLARADLPRRALDRSAGA